MATGYTLAPFATAARTGANTLKPQPPAAPAAAAPAAAAYTQPSFPLRLPATAASSAASAAAASAAAASAASALSSPSSAAFSPSSPSSSSSSAHTRFYYKVVARVGPNRFVSLYDGTTEYVLGRTISRPISAGEGNTLPDIHGGAGGGGDATARTTARSTARSSRSGRSTSRSTGSSFVGWKGDETRGGLFVCRTADEALSARIPDVAALFCAPRALIKCLCWGQALSYGSSTLAFEHLRPVQVYPIALGGYRSTAFGDRLLTSVSLSETRKRLPQFHGPRASVLRNYTQRQQMGELTKAIIDKEKKINDITRAQLGW